MRYDASMEDSVTNERSSVPPMVLGFDAQGDEAVLRWSNRVLRVTGMAGAGKTVLISDIVSKLDLDAVDLLVFHENEAESFYFPAPHLEDDISRFHETLLRLVEPRLAGDTARPLVLVIIGIGGMREAKLDVLRVARHAHELNAYVITEDTFHREKWHYDDDFTDLRPTKLIVNQPEAALIYGAGDETRLFRLSVRVRGAVRI